MFDHVHSLQKDQMRLHTVGYFSCGCIKRYELSIEKWNVKPTTIVVMCPQNEENLNGIVFMRGYVHGNTVD